jgi:lysophospholipase
MTFNKKAFFISILQLVGFMTLANDKFTTEEQLANRYSNEINSFWQQGDFSTFNGVNNSRINYAAFPNHHADNAKCIVISSGRSEGYLKYKELIFDLFNQGYSIFLHDHRGQGISQRLLDNPHKGYVEDFQYYIDDLAFFIDNIVAKQCSAKPYLLAHSMGGAIAARYLQDFPERIQAAVLSSPMLGFNGGGMPDFIAKSLVKTSVQLNQWFDDTPWFFGGQKNFTQDSFKNNRLMHSQLRYQAFTRLYKETPEIQLGGVTAQWLATSLSALEKLFSNINKITTPTLVLQAGDEKIVNNQAQDDFCTQLHLLQPQSCPNGKPIHIAKAYHELFFESDKYRTQALTATLEWFAKHSKINPSQ